MSQKDSLFILLSDGEPHSTEEIKDVVYGGSHLGLSRVASRINDLVKEGYVFLDKDGNPITEKGARRGWFDKVHKTIYWYWMMVDKKEFYADQYKVQTTFLTDNQFSAA